MDYLKSHGTVFLPTDDTHGPIFISSPRMEIATAVLQGIMAGGADKSNSITYLVQRSISYADEMLKQLTEPI